MTTRTVNGFVKNLIGKPYSSKTLKFRLVDIGADLVDNTLYISSINQVQTDTAGFFTVDLWTNENSIIPTSYRLVFDNGNYIEFNIPAGTTPLDITKLIINYA